MAASFSMTSPVSRTALLRTALLHNVWMPVLSTCLVLQESVREGSPDPGSDG